jgi:hypothetical protein
MNLIYLKSYIKSSRYSGNCPQSVGGVCAIELSSKKDLLGDAATWTNAIRTPRHHIRLDPFGRGVAAGGYR